MRAVRSASLPRSIGMPRLLDLPCHESSIRKAGPVSDGGTGFDSVGWRISLDFGAR